MDFQTPLIPARLIKRYKRFLADIELDTGAVVTAHCANPGSMMGMAEPKTKVWVEPNDDPKKKLKYSWKLNDYENGHFCVVDTSIANRIVKDALVTRQLAPFMGYADISPEVKYGDKSRVDFLLQDPTEGALYLEVKSVSLCRETGLAEFPDSVTARGAKHLHDLAAMVAQGHRAGLLFVVNRTDCSHLDVARDIDPSYASAFDQARAQGVEIYAYQSNISPQSITLGNPIPVKF